MPWVFFHQFSWGLWPRPHPLISELTMVGALRPANTSPDWNCLQYQKWSLQRQRRESTPVCDKLEKIGPASVDQSRSTASQDSCHVHGMSWMHPPTSPIPPFLLAQTYLWNGLWQLITCSQSCIMSALIMQLWMDHPVHLSSAVKELNPGMSILYLIYMFCV